MNLTSRHPGLISPDPEQRRLVVSRVAKVKDGDAVEVLLLGLGDDDWRVRKEAISAVQEMGATPELLDALVATFSASDNVGLRNAATEALGALGRLAAERLINELGLLDADGRKLAAEALGKTCHASAIMPLSRLMSDPDPNVRVAAIEALGCVGGERLDQVAPLLLSALGRSDVLERLATLEAILALGMRVPWEPVALAVNDPILQRAALTVAARSAAPLAGAPLVTALVSQLAGVRTTDLWPVMALAEFIESSEQALDIARAELARIPRGVRAALYDLMLAEEVEVRCSALHLVGAIGDFEASVKLLEVAEQLDMAQASEALLVALASLAPAVIEERLLSGTTSQRAWLLRMIAGHPNRVRHGLVLDAVSSALSADDETLMQVAFEVLETTSDERCLKLLASKLAVLPAQLRRTAIVVLQEMAIRHVELARAIAEAEKAEGGDALAAAVIIGALAAAGYGQGTGDTEFLTRALTHVSPSVRCASIDALADIGDSSSAEALAFSLADEENEVRLAAVRALGCLRDDRGSAAVVERLLDLTLRTDDRELLVAVVQALGDAGDPRAIPILRPIAKGGDPAVAVAAVEAIGQIHDLRRLEALIDGLSHRDVEVVKATMGVLSSESDARVDAHLGACLDHDSWDVRRLAADLLGQRGGEVAAGLLRAKRASEREPLVNEAIERALGQLEGTGSSRRSAPAPNQGSWRPR